MKLARMLRTVRPADFGAVAIIGQTRTWQELKANYPRLYRHDLAHVEEGPRAGAYGWNHAK